MRSFYAPKKSSASAISHFRWIAAMIFIISLANYAIDAYLRMSAAPGCQWNHIPNPNGFPYQVRFCYLNKETVSLRLYDAAGHQLLAERTFFELDRPLIYWESDALGYDVSNGQKIVLPPARLDRLRALMP